MNDKKTMNGKIILPERDGVANLDICRLKKELTSEDKPLEMLGYMPVEIIPEAVRRLQNVIDAVQRGEVSSVMVLSIAPRNNFSDVGSCFISAASDQLNYIHKLFHISLNERMDSPEIPPDEAG
jgi:hypothetical protein